MEIFESLQNRVSDIEGLQRLSILPSGNEISASTIVFIKVPPEHRFPYHIHSHSEDCFFILSGGGEVFDHKQSFAVSSVAGVWVPPGIPHGLSTNSLGVVEIGFQSPLGPTTETIPITAQANSGQIVTASIVPRSATSDESPEWSSVFQDLTGWRYFNPRYCHLKKAQKIRAIAENYELLLVVVSGKVHLQEQAVRVKPITIIQLKVGEYALLSAIEENTLIIGVRVYAA